MIIEIDDELDLEKIAFSGQCFRARKIGSSYRFITKNKFVDIELLKGNEYSVSCTEKDWHSVWHHYFDLSTKYSEIRERFKGVNKFLDASIDASKGLRILNQDKFEALISFIISQRKNIPAITKSIEMLCEKYGKKDKNEELYYFPDAPSLATKDNLDCSLGYRDEYVRNAAELIKSNTSYLENLNILSDIELLAALMSIKGVGIKVASCVALFAYSRGSIAPKDVWINRIIDMHFGSVSPFEQFGKYAGIIQQYMFYYQRTLNSSLSKELRQD